MKIYVDYIPIKDCWDDVRPTDIVGSIYGISDITPMEHVPCYIVETVSKDTMGVVSMGSDTIGIYVRSSLPESREAVKFIGELASKLVTHYLFTKPIRIQNE